MQLPKSTTLHSRLVASALVLWICFESHTLICAAEIPIPKHVQNSELAQSIPLALSDTLLKGGGASNLEERSDGVYAPDFAYFDRSVIGRQQEEVKQLTADKKEDAQATERTTKYFRFKADQSSGNGARAVPAGAYGPENRSQGKTDGESSISEEGAEEDGSEDGLEKRQSEQQIWISANTCRQPTPNVTIISGSPPQLTLYVSTSANNQKPGPDTPDTTAVPFASGFANVTLQTNSEIYIGVSAPSLPKGWDGSWSYEIAASVQGQYHNYANNSTFIFMVDTDSDSTLFITNNFTSSNSPEEVEKWRNHNPFSMYAFPTANWSDMTGLEASYCGLKQQFDSLDVKVSSSISTIFGNGIPVSQFHVQGLESNTNYTGFLAVAGNDTAFMDLPNIGLVRAGGEVFQRFEWKTKSGMLPIFLRTNTSRPNANNSPDDSCQVIFGLDFCSEVAYAVPSSGEFKNNETGLKSLYDDKAASYYQNFSKSLAQVACDTASTAQYSLARTCDDCRHDYKSWLCSVLIPRCESWNNTSPWLQERNINAPFADGTYPHPDNVTLEFNNTRRDRFAYSKSRNPIIDEVIKPGPYKELLPCDDLCFDLVRSCPAQLGFTCPNSPAKELTYGTRSPDSLTCNFPGAVVDLNPSKGEAALVTARMGMLVLVVVFAVAWDWI
jgi:calcium channel MID1